MAAAITQQLAELEMAGASVTFELELLDEAAWARTGPVKAELMYAPAPKVAALPLRKIASGGEISRVALAVRVVLGERDDVETLVFDEVDAGVGGTAAVALARVLERLGKTHQVLCVTHLAQVAARAQKQYVVTKGAGDVPVTQVVEVTGQARVEELARMLSGHVSETSLAHAAELLGSA
jgi:DNA repair protein RecN (Recombination protein N)